MRGRRWPAVGLRARLCLLVFLAEFGHGALLYALLPSRFPEAHHLVGYALASYLAAELGGKLWMGHWVDRSGFALPLSLGILGSAVSVWLPLRATAAGPVLISFAVHGAFAAAMWPAVVAATVAGSPPEKRGTILGPLLSAWMSGLGGGFVCGTFLAGRFDPWGEAGTAMVAGTWVAAVIALFWALALRPKAAAATPASVKASPLLPLPQALIPLIGGLFVQNLSLGLLAPLGQRYLVDPAALMIAPRTAAIIMAVGGGLAALLMGPLGRVADAWGQRRSVIAPLCLIGVGLAALGFLPGLGIRGALAGGLLVPMAAVGGCAYALMLPAWHALTLSVIDADRRARSLALLMTVEGMALAGGAGLGGNAAQRWGMPTVVLAAGALLLGVAAIYASGRILPTELDESPASPGAVST